MLFGCPRLATVVAVTHVDAYMLAWGDLQQLFRLSGAFHAQVKQTSVLHT